MLALLTACAPAPAPQPRPLDPVPVVEGVALLPVDPRLPLVRALAVRVSEPSVVRVALDDGSARTVAVAAEATIDVLRLRPDRDYVVTVTAAEGADPDRVSEPWTATFHTDPLPEDFPSIEVRASEPDRMEPGDTLVAPARDGGAGYALLLDPAGEVVWLFQDPDHRVWEIHPTERGTLQLWLFHGDIVEMDWAGREYGRWSSDESEGGLPVAVPKFHHDVEEGPDGVILALSQRVEVVDDFPVSYTDPAVREDGAAVLVDRVVGIEPATGAIRFELPLTRWLPLDRLGYESLRTDLGPGYDWAHANSVRYDPHRNELVISARNQDAVVGVAWGTWELDWLLANPDNWPPELEAKRLQPVGPPFDWFFHQHAPVPGRDGTLVLFDNGNDRATPWTGVEPLADDATWSRMLELAVDPDAGTVALSRSLEVPDARLFSPVEGNASPCPTTGGVVGAYGYVRYVNGELHEDRGYGDQSVRVVEHAADGAVVFDVELYSTDPTSSGWNAFRAVRVQAGVGLGADGVGPQAEPVTASGCRTR